MFDLQRGNVTKYIYSITVLRYMFQLLVLHMRVSDTAQREINGVPTRVPHDSIRFRLREL